MRAAALQMLLMSIITGTDADLCDKTNKLCQHCRCHGSPTALNTADTYQHRHEVAQQPLDLWWYWHHECDTQSCGPWFSVHNHGMLLFGEWAQSSVIWFSGSGNGMLQSQQSFSLDLVNSRGTMWWESSSMSRPAESTFTLDQALLWMSRKRQ